MSYDLKDVAMVRDLRMTLQRIAGVINELDGGGVATVAGTAGNVPVLASDGTLANSTIVGADIVTKVAGATEGNVVTFSSDGKIANSTIAGGDIVTKVNGATNNNVVFFDANGKIKDNNVKVATDAEFTAMLDEVLPTVSGS